MHELSLGEWLQLLTIFSILGGGGMVAYRQGRTSKGVEAAVTAIVKEQERHGADIDDLKFEIKKLTEIIIQQRLVEERMNHIQFQVDELRHGRGFIQAIEIGGQS